MASNTRLRRSGDINDLCSYPAIARACATLHGPLLHHWHALFDHCPSVLTLDPPDGARLFVNFIKHARDNNQALDWTLYLNLYRWLVAHWQAHTTDEMLEDLMLASAASWNSGVGETAILIRHPSLSGLAVMAANGQNDVDIVSAEASASVDFKYCLLSRFTPELVQWMAVP
jgi:hypothetical protein